LRSTTVFSIQKLLILLLLFSSTHAEASDNELHLGRFSTKDLTGWKEQTLGLLKSKTVYTLSRDNDKDVLGASSTKSASGQIYALKLDPKEYHTLKWSWKIDHTIKKGDEKNKDGDDFAARVYVVFPRGFFSKTRAICYVWANKLPKGEHLTSPFTPNIITVAVDSGEELAGRWTFHQRNIYEDYRTFFGEEPPRIGAVALMTDTDNTGESATGYYGDISLVRSPKTEEAKRKDQKTKEAPQKEAKGKEPDARGTKGNGEPAQATTKTLKPGKTIEDSKPGEANNNEQPPGTSTAVPAAAPQPALPN
jgi:hypothetical protein